MINALLAAGFQPGEWFQLAAITPAAKISCRTFNAPAAAKTWADAHVASPANLYLGSNPLVANIGTRRANASDIAVPRCLLFDCDPEGDKTGADVEKRAACVAVVADASRWIWERTGHKCTTVDSGRGMQLWIIHEPNVDREALLKGLSGRFGREGVKIDSTYDLPRLMRLPGYRNLKTGRMATICE